MQSKAKTVVEYLKELPPDRRETVVAVRKILLENVGPEVEEGMQYGMLGYYIPHRVYPAGYHCDPKQPLPFICFASQKNYLTLHMMSLYGVPAHEAWFRERWARSGKKLDMGKCCIRFKSLDDIDLSVIAEAIQRVPVQTYIEFCEAFLGRRAAGKPAKKSLAAGKKKLAEGGSKGAKSDSKAPRKPAAKPAAAKKPATKASRPLAKSAGEKTAARKKAATSKAGNKKSR